MLVLSRNEKQGIRFPGLGVSVEILEVAGNKVKVGVDAEQELADSQFRMQLPRVMRHELRNALHEISLNLHVYLKRIESEAPHTEAGPIDAEEMFQAIVKRLEQIGGRESCHLPLAMPSSEAVSQPEESLGHALVVDDDDNERELLAGFLRMCNYEVSTVQDGIEADNFLKQNTAPHVILLDMFMPRCDGRTFLSELRTQQRFNDTHVFVVSGSSPEELQMSVRKGYTHWFSKPLDPRLIVDSLGSIESRRELQTAG